MKTTAIHQHDDWYSVHLPGYGDMPKEELEVDINVTDKSILNMDYKALRGAMIMERYEEKRERNIVEESMKSYKYDFSQLLKGDIIYTMDDLMNAIKSIPKRNDIYTR
jgi:hypothetical protein